MYLEFHKDNFTISTDPEKLDFEAIYDFLARSYWADKRPRAVIDKSLKNSLCFGLYDGSKQIGLARVITDYATFAYLCDVFVNDEYRGQGLGKWLIKTVMEYPELQMLRRWLLATRDAHGLYKQSGFVPMQTPDRWMEIFRDNI